MNTEVFSEVRLTVNQSDLRATIDAFRRPQPGRGLQSSGHPKGSATLAIEWTKTGDGAVAGLSAYERFNLIHAPRRSVTISIQQDEKDRRA
jgi:hypothetical protein